jgi:hypothetical protein
MPDPILVVDFGTAHTATALVLGDQWRLITEPATRAPYWPAVAAEPAGVEPAGPEPRASQARSSPLAGQVAAYLEVIRAQAERWYSGRVERLTLAVPPEYGDTDPRRDGLIAAGNAAGFPDVELVPDSVAAVLDAVADRAVPDAAARPAALPAAAVPPVPERGIVLVCDLGATWTTALVRVAGDGSRQLAQLSSPGGREIERHLLAGLRREAGQWLEPMLAAPGDAGTRAHHELADLVRRLTHRLADAPAAADRLTPDTPPLRLTRTALSTVAEPVLRWVVDGCAHLAAGAGGEVAGVVLAGGWSRHPGVAEYLSRALGRPVRPAADPELAVVRGAARWATGAARRRVPADAPPWRAVPLSWRIPDGAAELTRWLVEPGLPYGPGAALAQVRTSGDQVFDLVTPRGGTLLAPRPAAGARVGPALVTAASRSGAALLAEAPPHRHRWWAGGGWLLTAGLLVEYDWRYVGFRQVSSGGLTGTFHPDAGGTQPRAARVFADPDGRLCLFTWDAAGEFTVWDIAAGRIRGRFPGPPGTARVFVDEAGWRLAAEGGDTVSVGRYRRTITTFWDLRTGQRLDRVLDDEWRRRHPEYVARSGADRFAESAGSPDGQLHATTSPGSLAVRAAGADTVVFRVAYPPAAGPRRGAGEVHAAFTDDGRFLLATWAGDDRSLVDVWQI